MYLASTPPSRLSRVGTAISAGLLLAAALTLAGCGIGQKMSTVGGSLTPEREEAPAPEAEQAPAPAMQEGPAAPAPAAPSPMPAETAPQPATTEEAAAPPVPPAPAEPETYEVTVPEGAYMFVPRQLTIYEGDTVVWKNVSGLVHLFATIPGSDPSGVMEIEPTDLLVGESVSHTFAKAGTYPYFCFIHNRMTGKIVVLPR